MADATYDAVIIGGGQHGLILGLYLRKAGLSTVVLERQHEMGGALCGEEVPLPGYLINTCSHWTRWYSHPVFEEFHLRDYGLKLYYPEGGAGMMFDNGTCVVGYTAYPVVDQETGRSEFSPKNVAKTLEQVARFSKRDAETLERFIKEWDDKWQSAFWEYFWTPPTPYGVKNALERALDTPGLIEPVHHHMSMRQLAYDLFESPEMRCLLLRGLMVTCALHFDTVVGIENLLSALTLCASMRAACVNAGGSHGVVHALVRAYADIGGKFHVQSEVNKIIIENGQAKGVRLLDGTTIEAKKMVISTVDIEQTICRFVGEEYVGHRIAHRARNVWYGFGLLWTTIVLRELPDYIAADYNPDILSSPRLQLGPLDPHYLTTKYDAECYLRGYSQRMCLCTGMDTLWDPSRAPAGKHIIGIEQASAPTSYFTEREWLQIKKDYIPHMMAQWPTYARNITWENLLGWNIQCAYDIEKRNINMHEGDTAVGKMVTSQLGRFRPFPELSGYRTPVKNLYIGGACTHYGLGNARSCSYNCYKIISEDFGLPKPEVWRGK
jgi:phytoene dehydrogenase-like protein